MAILLKMKEFELLFTHCWNGMEDLPFPTSGPEASAIRGKKVKELPWLVEELKEDTEFTELPDHMDWTLDGLRVGDWDGDDEVYGYATLKAPDGGS